MKIFMMQCRRRVLPATMCRKLLYTARTTTSHPDKSHMCGNVSVTYVTIQKLLPTVGHGRERQI